MYPNLLTPKTPYPLDPMLAGVYQRLMHSLRGPTFHFAPDRTMVRLFFFFMVIVFMSIYPPPTQAVAQKWWKIEYLHRFHIEMIGNIIY